MTVKPVFGSVAHVAVSNKELGIVGSRRREVKILMMSTEKSPSLAAIIIPRHKVHVTIS